MNNPVQYIRKINLLSKVSVSSLVFHLSERENYVNGRRIILRLQFL
jgi:hypothetical protein